MALQDLPLDILLEIAKSQPWVGCGLSKTVRRVGLYSLKNDMKKWFKTEEDGETFILVKAAEEPYYKELRHSWNDKPAVINSDGDKWWYKRGMIHRDNDLPAVINSTGGQHWYKKGNRHRDSNLPAMIDSGGNQWWYKKDKIHRDNDQPAVIYSDGRQYWYKEGKLYR